MGKLSWEWIILSEIDNVCRTTINVDERRINIYWLWTNWAGKSLKENLTLTNWITVTKN